MERIELTVKGRDELKRHLLTLQLIEIREKHRYSQHDVARRMGDTHQSAISDFENNETKNPSLRVLQKYARALGYRMEITLVRDK